MKLPKLYRPVWITFDSLRNGLGDGYGVIFDIDTTVSRKCRRIASAEGWAWQIVNGYEMSGWDYFVETDDECLNENPLEFNYGRLAALKESGNGKS